MGRTGRIPLVRGLTVEQHLALRAFEHGYHCGADPQRERRRHTVDPATDRHWRAGYQLGRAAAARTSAEYKRRLLAETEGGQGTPQAES